MCDCLAKEYPQFKREILSAPNRYRKADDSIALDMQRKEWPDKAERALGKDICFMCWDEILVWNVVA